MRSLVTVLLLLVPVVVFSQVLSGTKTVGGGGDYSDLSSAFAAINSNGVSGTLTLSIIGNFTEPGTTALTRSDLSSSNNVLIRPAASTTPVITVSGTDGVDINGASYVTIDGSNSGGTSRDLTIKRSSQASGSAIIYLHGSGGTVTVKNCILGDATNTPDYAVRVEGPSNVVIQNNEIHGIGNANGIVYFSSVNGTSNLITQNTISGDQTGSSKAYGINLDAGGGSMTISKNRLHVLKTSGGTGISGIRERMGSGTLAIYNNFVGGGFVSTGGSDYYLLDFGGGGDKEVFHNTLLLNTIAGTPFDAAALYVFDGTCDFRNNIVVNNYDAAESSCINNSLLQAADLTTNYNNLYAPGSSNNVGFDGQFQSFATLPDWQAWTGVNPDPNSVSVSVSFTNSANDFHLSGGSIGNVQLRGTDALIATVADDIDGDARQANPNGPYMGADEGSSALPVQMASFTATATGLTAQLIWRTQSELENYGFEIERRSVGLVENRNNGNQPPPNSNIPSFHYSSWRTIGFVQGAGTSSSPQDYSFIDRPDQPGRYAYRIKQIDYSGAFVYTSAVEVEIGLAPLEFSLNQNYPNPFNPTTAISFSVASSGPTTLRIYDMLGRQVDELFNGTAEAGRLYQVDFNGSGLASGVYIARLQSGSESQLVRMILAR